MKQVLFAAVLLLASSLAPAQETILFNGGVTSDERAEAPVTGTKLVFFVEAGNFLAGVQVVVKDSSGQEVVNVRTSGPWLILNLPNGRYTVRAAVGDSNAQGGYIEVDGSAREYAYMFRGL